MLQKLFTLQIGKFCFTGNSQLCFPVCDNRNQQTEMLKKGVNSTTETRKMGICHLSLITKPLDKLCVWSILSKGIPPPPLPPSLIFMASLPRYQKTYLLCIIGQEYSSSVKTKTQISRYFKKSLKIVILAVFAPSSSIKIICEIYICSIMTANNSQKTHYLSWWHCGIVEGKN